MFKAITVQGTPRHFSVYRRGGIYWINAVTHEGVVEKPCHPGAQTEEQIKREIGLLFGVAVIERI